MSPIAAAQSSSDAQSRGLKRKRSASAAREAGSSKVYRVQGIPLGCNRKDVRQLLGQLLDLETDASIVRIRSLAISPNLKTKTAIIDFLATPHTLVSERSEWNFTVPDNHRERKEDEENNDDLAPKSPHITVDTHFRGLTVLRSFGEESDHVVDCVAVTGLGGHAFGSFKERGGPHMWLCDALPHDLPGARIVLWGYDSRTSRSTSFQDFEALGTRLRSALKMLNQKQSKPLIFVAHSLGGLIFKEAVIQMKRDNDQQKLLNYIYGALFFGVPSQGMDITSLIPMVKEQPNQALIHSLGKESQLLRNQRRDFPKAFDYSDSEIFYFYETVMSPTAILREDKWEMKGDPVVLVDSVSAIHGRPNETQPHNIHALDKTHSDLVKFASHDEEYQVVLNVLHRQASAAVKAIPQRMIDLEAKRLEFILGWLVASDPTVNHTRARCLCQDNTGTWLTSSRSFGDWIALKNSVLWLYGIPGSGKTILSSTIIESLKDRRQRSSSTVLGYFYFDFNDAKKQKAEDLSLSLLSQFCAQCKRHSQCSEVFEDLYQQSKKSKVPLHSDQTEAILLALLEDFVEVYIVIDALDECTERKAALKFLKKMKNAEFAHVHVLVTSRKEDDIERALQSIASECIDLQNQGTDADIQRYIEDQLETDDTLRRRPPSVRNEIKDALLSKAKGMFRWVVCQLDVLRECDTPIELAEALASLPATLDQTYARILLRIPHRACRTTLRIFHWLIFSKRPMRLVELAEIFVADPDMQPRFDPGRRPFNPEDMVRHCRSLFSIQRRPQALHRTQLDGEWPHFAKDEISLNSEDEASLDSEDEHFATNKKIADSSDHTTKYSFEELEISIAHYSIQEFLVSNRVFDSDCAKYGVTEPEANLSIARTCLIYLRELQSSHVWLNRDFKELPLMNYAGKFWSDHACAGGGREIDKMDVEILEFLRCATARTNWVLLRYTKNTLSHFLQYRGPPDTVAPPLLCAISMGLERTIKTLTERGEDMNGVINHQVSPLLGFSTTALGAATWQRKERVVQALLKLGVDVNKRDASHMTALQLASEKGDITIMRLLLDHGANIETKTADIKSALYLACESGHEAAARLLLDRGASCHAKDNSGMTALHIASSNNHKAVVQLLLEREANVNAINQAGRTALHEASNGGYATLVQLLLEHGADINAKREDRGTALHEASAKGHEPIVRLLLDRGADVNAENKDGETALHGAIEGGYESVVLLLLDHGADATRSNARDGLIGTPLKIASAQGNIAMVRLLLEQRKELEVGDSLHAALVKGRGEVVEMLLEKGAEIDFREERDQPALHEAASDGNEAGVQLLLERGASVNCRRKADGRTALEEASRRGDENIVRILLKHGANLIPWEPSDRRLALHEASARGHKIIVRILLERGADVNLRRAGDGWSALHEASAHGHRNVVRLLLEQGAKFKADDESCKDTALTMALENGHEDVVRILLEHGAEIKFRGERFGPTSWPTASLDSVAAGLTMVLNSAYQSTAEAERDTPKPLPIIAPLPPLIPTKPQKRAKLSS